MDFENQSSTAAEDFRTIMASSIDGFTLVNHSGHILDVNDSYCQMIGYTRHELLNRHVSVVDAIDTAEDVAKRSEEILLRGSLRFETKHLHKDGSVIDVEVSANYTPVHGGSFFSLVRDISQQKQIEKALRESEQKYRLMFECAGDSISVMDLHGTLLTVNPLACTMLGYTYAELTALSADKIDSRPDVMAANIGTLLENGYYSGETEFVRKDGSIVPISL